MTFVTCSPWVATVAGSWSSLFHIANWDQQSPVCTGQHSLASVTTGPQMVRSHLADRRDSTKHHCLRHTRLLGQPLKSLVSRPQYAHSAKWVPFCFLKAPSKSLPRPAGFIVSDSIPVPELLCLINLLLQLLPPSPIISLPRDPGGSRQSPAHSQLER